MKERGNPRCFRVGLVLLAVFVLRVDPAEATNTGSMDAWAGNSPALFIYNNDEGNSGPAVDTAGFEDPETGEPAQVLYSNLLTLPQDSDGDGIENSVDNCPDVTNAGQENQDGDMLGDACDLDDDNDNLLDIVETGTGVFVDANDTGTNPLDSDTDGDGVSDGDEVDRGTNPVVADSVVSEVPGLSGLGLLLMVLVLLLLGSLGLGMRRGSV